MPGRGRAPKDPASRRNTNPPERGEWKPAPGVGWQWGKIPSPPSGMRSASATAWRVWFGAWFASHWREEDVPALRQVLRLYDAVERGDLTRAGELRQMMDAYGITPKGQQDRRWLRPGPDPVAATPEPPAEESEDETQPADSPYRHLRAVGGRD